MTDHPSDSPYRKAHEPPARKGSGRKRRKSGSRRPGNQPHPPAAAKRKKKRRPGRKPPGKSSSRGHGAHGLTSLPTNRGAQITTRAWLLQQYGPVCAYCGTRHPARSMTLDHVAPRRGQSAYDRRDNLVLACRTCNAAKRDQSPLAFLLALRSRAVNLVKFGAHLSHGLLEMARSLIPAHTESSRTRIDYSRWGPSDDSDDDSPYRR